METILFYAKLGFNHVLDFQALDHFYFIIALCLPFSFNEFKKLLWWVTLFTLGHTLSLFGNYYFEINLSAVWIEFLIPLTIALSCIPLIINKTSDFKTLFPSLITLVFGLIHGFGFGRYFSLIVSGDEALTELLSFALGVEAIQVCIVMGLLLVNFLVTRILKIPSSKWQMFIGAMILSQALAMIIKSSPF
ncbi:HupE/UreJ family protein [Flavobacteriaceae bacterium]|nr:HupE/UreJ family protein [Flavobacteriaceae bacterium]